MPLGWERLNTKSSTPNPNVVFIKPLTGATESTALDFLNRLAAICVPICKANYLYVASLEEFPPNREFWGRNFNAGEVIQLVLRSPSTGQWLPFRFVQMVLMHELAHCKEMNHSGAFWKVRNQYASELRVLWTKNYTGEGLWGRGQNLYNGQYTTDALPSDEILPASLCGGTFRSRRKRKRKGKQPSEKSKITYAERKQRRIEKKFGKAGQGLTLGGDDATRVILEGGKVIKGKPRVANSDRGRNLRAAAAEARLKAGQEAAARSAGPKIKQEDNSETESEYEWSDSEDEKEAVDLDGTKLTDTEGRNLVKVCEDEDAANDPNAMNELEELGNMTLGPPTDSSKQMKLNGKGRSKPSLNANAIVVDDSDGTPIKETKSTKSNGKSSISPSKPKPKTNNSKREDQGHKTTRPKAENSKSPSISIVDLVSTQDQFKGGAQGNSNDKQSSEDVPSACPVCSFENDPIAFTCMACAHVLDPSKSRNHWRCKSLTCRGGIYVNSSDAGICGVCGARKETAS